ncbi:MAG: RbsD/FucU domain-containing protein [Nitratireductor sp.]|nr:transporter [Nitratireductor sp.]
MLIGIPPCLGPDLLRNLCAMGHGDEIAIVDGNYPAQAHGMNAPGGVVRADGVGALELLDAILRVMPIDQNVDDPFSFATVDGDGKTLAPIHHAMNARLDAWKAGTRAMPMLGADFYARVRRAHTLVATSEPALYGNIILRKGVINPE